MRVVRIALVAAVAGAALIYVQSQLDVIPVSALLWLPGTVLVVVVLAVGWYRDPPRF